MRWDVPSLEQFNKYRDSILLYLFSKNRGSLELWYIKQEKKCFITRWNTTKRVENTTRSGVFLKKIRGVSPGLVMKHCVQCFILLFNQNDFKRRNKWSKNEQFFIWFPNTGRTGACYCKMLLRSFPTYKHPSPSSYSPNLLVHKKVPPIITSHPTPLKCSEMNLIYYDVLKLNYKPVKLTQNVFWLALW